MYLIIYLLILHLLDLLIYRLIFLIVNYLNDISYNEAKLILNK